MSSPTDTVRVSKVVVEAKAALKIIRYCEEFLPAIDSGSLIGVHSGGIVRITDAFGPTEDSLRLLALLRDVNAESTLSGWFIPSFMGAHLSETALRTQLEHQSSFQTAHAVFLCYDVMAASAGQLSFHAYRLTDKAVKALSSPAGFSLSALRSSEFSASEFYDEIPVEFGCDDMSRMVINFLRLKNPAALAPEASTLSVTDTAYLERLLDGLTSKIDAFSVEQRRSFHAAKADTRASKRDSRLEYFLAAAQVQHVAQTASEVIESAQTKVPLIAATDDSHLQAVTEE